MKIDKIIACTTDNIEIAVGRFISLYQEKTEKVEEVIICLVTIKYISSISHIQESYSRKRSKN